MRVWVPDEVVGGLKQILESKPEFRYLLSNIKEEEAALKNADRAYLLAEAKRLYADHTDDVEIDDDAQLSRGENGTWVQAWVWVYQEENDVEEQDKDAEEEAD